MAANVVRVLRWFELDGDDFIGDEEMKGVQLSDLQLLFNEPSTELMYDCYEVTTKKQVLFLQRYVSHKIDLKKYAYFVEADAIE